MAVIRSEPKFDPVVKTLHWSWAFLWLTVWAVGILSVYWRDTLNADHELTVTHKALGMTVLVIIGLWTAWRLLVNPSPPMSSRTEDEAQAHRGHIVIVVLALFGLPITGWLLSSALGEPTTLFWMIKVPALISPDPLSVAILNWTHTIIAWLMFLLIAVHISVALAVHFFDGKDTLLQMLPGRVDYDALAVRKAAIKTARKSAAINTPRTGPIHAATRGKRFERSIIIEAPSAKVWENLKDFSGSGDWNPLYKDTDGVLELGEALDATLTLEDTNPIPFTATVLSCVPEKLIEYETLVFGGGIRALRYIEIHAEGPLRSKVVNGEVVSGPLKFLSPKKVGDAVMKGLAAMNETLKKKSEI